MKRDRPSVFIGVIRGNTGFAALLRMTGSLGFVPFVCFVGNLTDKTRLPGGFAGVIHGPE